MIHSKDLLEIENSPILSEDEREAKQRLEEFIDEQLRSRFGNGEAHVDDFNEVPIYRLLRSARMKVVREALLEEYKKNGWTVTYDPGEDDGPNRPAIGCYIFKSKK